MIDELVAFASEPIELLLNSTDRAQIAHTFLHWFQATGKRAVPDLEQRVLDYQKKLATLALNIRFKYVNADKSGQLVAEADGANAVTLAELKAGTLWFDGWNRMEYEVLCVIQD